MATAMPRRNLFMLGTPVRRFATQTSESVIDDIVSFARQAQQVRFEWVFFADIGFVLLLDLNVRGVAG